jgi:Putative addiction module component
VTDATNRVLQQALELEPEERAALAAELLASLDASENDVQSAWAAEIERRPRDAAEERGEDWRVVLDDIRASVLQR